MIRYFSRASSLAVGKTSACRTMHNNQIVLQWLDCDDHTLFHDHNNLQTYSSCNNFSGNLQGSPNNSKLPTAIMVILTSLHPPTDANPPGVHPRHQKASRPRHSRLPFHLPKGRHPDARRRRKHRNSHLLHRRHLPRRPLQQIPHGRRHRLPVPPQHLRRLRKTQGQRPRRFTRRYHRG